MLYTQRTVKQVEATRIQTVEDLKKAVSARYQDWEVRITYKQGGDEWRIANGKLCKEYQLWTGDYIVHTGSGPEVARSLIFERDWKPVEIGISHDNPSRTRP